MSDTQTTATTLPEARSILERIGLPAAVRGAFTIGGRARTAKTDAEFDEAVRLALDESATTEVLIEPVMAHRAMTGMMNV